ncbi:MAG TPA: oligosaccharide flippase family protein [Anaerolineales bacterium]|nr:oligosaccharide flippase family protein [Anaerolineales bacterium]
MRTRFNKFAGTPLISRILRNSAYLFSASGIAVVLGFFQNLLVTNLLGVALFGILGGVVSFTSVINKLGSFRMSELVVRYVGQYTEEGDAQSSAAVFKFACYIESLSSLFSFGLIVLLAPLGARFLAKDITLTEVFILYGLIVVGNLVFESATGLLQILDRFRAIAAVQTAQSALTLVLISLAFVSGGGLVDVVLAYMAGKFLAGLGVAALAFREAGRAWGRGWSRTPLTVLRGRYRELLGFAFNTNLSATINLVNKDSEQLWVLLFRNPTEAGWYKLAIALANLVLIPISPLPQATYPELAREVARKAWGNVRYVLRQGSRVAALYTGAAALFLVVFGRPLIELLYPEAFLQAYPALMIMLVGLLVANSFYWNRTALLSLDRPGYPTKVNAIAAVLKIALTLVLVPRFGYLAAAGLLTGYYLFSIGLNVRKTYLEISAREVTI